MSDRPTFWAPLLRAAGIVQPSRFDREGRILLIGTAARALLDSRMPAPEAALFLAGALLGWLENGGNLERDYFQVVRPKSHRTPAAIWREINAHPDEEQATAHSSTLPPTSTDRSK